MLERISSGWELTKQSFRVLKLDKELLLFPILSGIACLLVLASFAVPLFFSGALNDIAERKDNSNFQILAFVILSGFYFVNYFVIVFFNSALVACAVIRLKGGNPTVGDGLAAAMSRVPQIAGWALVSATVGLILKSLESRRNRAGHWLAGILGMAWSITTFFAIPVLVIERVGPFAAIQRSLSIVRQTWGESLTANFSIRLITFALSIVGLVPIGLGAFSFASGAPIVGIALIVVGVIWMLVISVITSALHTIILAALYIYAAEGRIPREFDSDLIEHAFLTK